MDDFIKYGPIAVVFVVVITVITGLAQHATSDLWKIVKSNKRIAIIAAHVIALIATLAWGFSLLDGKDRPATVTDVGRAMLFGALLSGISLSLTFATLDRMMDVLERFHERISSAGFDEAGRSDPVRRSPPSSR